MIISHSHKFIFIHCRKVAGSSMKVAIAPYLTGEDIVIGSLNEILQAGGGPTAAMQKRLSHPGARLAAFKERRRGKTPEEAQNIALKKTYTRALGRNPAHPNAKKAAQFAGAAWQNYRKFCFIRNPWTRVVSDYYWRRRATGKTMSFETYLRALANGESGGGFVHPGMVTNWDMIATDGKIQVDDIGRFESLETDFPRLCQSVGLPPLTLATSQKASKNKPDYNALYTPNCKKLVETIFAPEFEAFDYRWPFD